jgi:hypothetical protein
LDFQSDKMAEHESFTEWETARVLLENTKSPRREIDAVFVTVAPHGGSQKPTGKPFLYAMLRKEANHP